MDCRECINYSCNEGFALSWKVAAITTSFGLGWIAASESISDPVSCVGIPILAYLGGTFSGFIAGNAYGLIKWSFFGAPEQNQKSIQYGKYNLIPVLITMHIGLKLQDYAAQIHDEEQKAAFFDYLNENAWYQNKLFKPAWRQELEGICIASDFSIPIFHIVN